MLGEFVVEYSIRKRRGERGEDFRMFAFEEMDWLKGTVRDGEGFEYVGCWSARLEMCRTGKMIR